MTDCEKAYMEWCYRSNPPSPRSSSAGWVAAWDAATAAAVEKACDAVSGVLMSGFKHAMVDDAIHAAFKEKP